MDFPSGKPQPCKYWFDKINLGLIPPRGSKNEIVTNEMSKQFHCSSNVR